MSKPPILRRLGEGTVVPSAKTSRVGGYSSIDEATKPTTMGKDGGRCSSAPSPLFVGSTLEAREVRKMGRAGILSNLCLNYVIYRS